MKWFGQTWGAPVCHELDWIETPSGESCIYCPRPIGVHDQGFALPHLSAPDASVGAVAVVVYAHRACLLRAVGVGVPVIP